MESIVTVGFFIFGTIIGSFLNVVILRYNTGASFYDRSRCFSCGRGIVWYDLVPVASFLALRGRCRFCKSKLSLQYPLVELITGLLFLGVLLKFLASGVPFSTFYFILFTFDLAVLSLLVVIAVYDLKHKIIPDLPVFLFAGVSLVRLFSLLPFWSLFSFPHILDLLAGPILALPLFLLWFLSRGRWIGLGDAKLALGMGWFLGLSLGVSALVWGFWIGALVGLSLIGLSKISHAALVRSLLLKAGLKSLTMGSEIPLAPFLIAGLFISYFLGADVTGLSVLGI